MHARPICIEDSGDFNQQAVLTLIIEEQGFRTALAFVVAGAWAGLVDLFQLALSLGMHFRVAIDLACRGLNFFAFVRLARPSMLIAPCTLVLVV
jgi:hypothetical protein